MKQTIEQFNKKYDTWLVAQLLLHGSNPLPKSQDYVDATMLSSACGRMHMKWNGMDGYVMTRAGIEYCELTLEKSND